MRIIDNRYETNILDWYVVDSTDTGILYTQKFVVVNTPNKINKKLDIHYQFDNKYQNYIREDMNYLIHRDFIMDIIIIDNNICVLCEYIN